MTGRRLTIFCAACSNSSAVWSLLLLSVWLLFSSVSRCRSFWSWRCVFCSMLMLFWHVCCCCCTCTPPTTLEKTSVRVREIIAVMYKWNTTGETQHTNNETSVTTTPKVTRSLYFHVLIGWSVSGNYRQEVTTTMYLPATNDLSIRSSRCSTFQSWHDTAPLWCPSMCWFVFHLATSSGWPWFGGAILALLPEQVVVLGWNGKEQWRTEKNRKEQKRTEKKRTEKNRERTE